MCTGNAAAVAAPSHKESAWFFVTTAVNLHEHGVTNLQGPVLVMAGAQRPGLQSAPSSGSLTTFSGALARFLGLMLPVTLISATARLLMLLLLLLLLTNSAGSSAALSVLVSGEK
jgi:hypothetical protein